MNLIELIIKGISYSQTKSGAYTLMLGEIEGERVLPVIIGTAEAQAIVIALEKEINPPRPLTHDLFKSFADEFAINIKRVVIRDLVDGIFLADLICEHGEEQRTIDSRVSDAIALAIRFKAPIFTYKAILDKAGIYLQATMYEQDKESLDTSGSLEKIELEKQNYTLFSLKKLQEKLNHAISDEDYELAAKIRDEIGKRTEKM